MKADSSEKKSECLLCGLQFNHRSSLIRHTRNNCNKNPSQRRKSCNQCIANKTRCTLKRPTCAGCSLRQIACVYTSSGGEQSEQPVSPGIASAPLEFDLDTLSSFQPQNLSARFDSTLFEPFFGDLEPWTPIQPSELVLQARNGTGREILPLSDSVEFASSEIAFSRSNQQIDRDSGTNSAALVNHSMELIFRVCRTWPQMLADGFQIPPIFHPTHLASQTDLPRPLATCITLVKMWHGQCPGAETIVRDTIRRELDLAMNNSDELDEATLLATLQAVVMYTIILLAPFKTSPSDCMSEDAIFRKVEIFVWHVVRGDLFLPEERAQTRPSWDAWIHVTAKRRAILALYLLHWAYSVLHKVPCFDCSELGFMPAPAPKALWQAHTEQEWNSKYIHWLARWNGQIYLQAEFGHIKPGAVLSPRAEKWLGEADEFGFIMASILNATEFNPPSYKVAV
ncbi:hypothetical protein N7495_007013 [Penicillium taxi]|uniref:uncharacterized protein n=1 Tax=Penicillium taxi TaxID=168475 RepID=UPI0025450C6C|nr:uncharacterized protein N7495_007013 [Penicillium taxi]KAJ5895322.1 hypothetical protein N7495_007013 [Penicillium taxi]